MRKRILYHVAFWAGYVLYKSYLNVLPPDFPLSPRVAMIVVGAQLAFLLIKVPMVYTLFYMAEKYFSKHWSMIRTILAIGGLLILSVTLFLPVRKIIVLEMIYGVEGSWKESFGLPNIRYTFFLLGFTCSIALAIKLVRLTVRQREAEQEMSRRKLETELRFLKAQINPHFFFNTLNNIYALARKKSDDTPGVVMKLSKLFRFILYESQKQYIPIADEIHVLENYIELESIRYNEKLQLNFVRSIDDESQLIAPLILLPFVENTFKHGVSESRLNSYIDIDLRIVQQQLTFICENSRAESIGKKRPERIGLGNIRRQLELQYAEHTLDIENTSSYFRVSLKINLSSQRDHLPA